MNGIRTRRLAPGDEDLAMRVFRMMSDVFGEAQAPLAHDYIAALLARDEFWVIAAFEGDAAVGGLTAHTLPMTSSPAREVFIYDVAVHPGYQRRGVGRQLVDTLRELAGADGIDELFVPADREDTHALDFYRAIGGEEAHVSLFTFHSKD